MAQYTINDFQKGDTVYHLSNIKLMMVAVEINKEMGEISCRWVDKDGKIQCVEFMPEELGKGEDLGLKVSYVEKIP